MKQSYEKLTLSVLLMVIAMSLFGQVGAKELSEKEFLNLGKKSMPMDIKTFKQYIGSAHLSDQDLKSLLMRLTGRYAAVRDRGDKIIFLAEKMSPSKRRDYGLGAQMLWAYKKNDRPMITKLRALGGDMSHTLGLAAIEDPSLIPAMLKDGAQPDARTLQMVIFAGKGDGIMRSIFSQLLKAAKNINEQSPVDGSTVLQVAVEEGEKKIAEMILKAGANPNIKNKKGESALSLAKKAGLTDLVSLFEKKQGVQRRSRR